jgi:hypothetical protein
MQQQTNNDGQKLVTTKKQNNFQPLPALMSSFNVELFSKHLFSQRRTVTKQINFLTTALQCIRT